MRVKMKLQTESTLFIRIYMSVLLMQVNSYRKAQLLSPKITKPMFIIQTPETQEEASQHSL